MLGLDDVDDHLDEGRRGEELAVVVGLLVGELHEEVFVDAAEHVARGRAEGFSVEDLQQSLEEVVVEAGVVLWQHAEEGVEVLLNGLHGVDEGLAPLGVAGQGDDVLEAGVLG